MKRFLVTLLSGSAGFSLASMLLFENGSFASQLFAVSFSALLFALVYAAFGRVHLAIVVATGAPLSIFLVSQVKLHFWGVPFLFFDLIFLVRQNFLELLQNDYRFLAATAALVAAVAGVAFALWRAEPPRRMDPRWIGASLMIAVTACASSIQEMREMWTAELVSGDHTVASFLASALHAGVRLRPASAPGSVSAEGFIPVRSSGEPGSWPDIICVLEESTFDARRLYRLDGRESRKLDEFFAPPGAKFGPLRVHMFGGATWVAEFALLTGIPHESFGENGSYVPYLLEGKIRHSLTSFLHDAGYHNVAVYPTSGNFVNGRRFYQSIGFDDFFDPATLTPSRHWDWHTPDAEIFAAALDEIRAIRDRVRKPIFAFILTMNQHQPHYATPDSEDLEGLVDRGEVEQGGVGAFAEYLFRLRQSVDGLLFLRERFASYFPGQRAVFLHFGDHHPPASWHLRASERFRNGIPEPLMQTYYSLSSAGFTLHPTLLDSFRPLDIAFLSTLLVKSIGLPTDQVFDKREALAVRCGGIYQGCTDSSLTALHDFLLNNDLVLRN